MISKNYQKYLNTLADDGELATTTCATPLGTLYLAASPRGLVFLSWRRVAIPLGTSKSTGSGINEAKRILRGACTAIKGYFQGKTANLDKLPLDPQGSPFQHKVWQAMRKVRAGATISYQGLAQRTGNRSAARAVARACASNPIPLIVPCHRVITSDNKLGGFSAGLHRKRYLLQHECSL